MSIIRSLDIYAFTKTIVTGFGIYVVWIVIHYVPAHMYTYWCVPATFFGFLAAPFLVPAPHCQALRWAIYNGGNSIIAMWFLLGAWFMRLLKMNE